ncbi:MAG: hypothetical protein U5O39_00380 [Gammaproteobacteria bacterium]|nr:hypothetical protein [Gammaproteobacteria bacterium]
MLGIILGALQRCLQLLFALFELRDVPVASTEVALVRVFVGVVLVVDAIPFLLRLRQFDVRILQVLGDQIEVVVQGVAPLTETPELSTS